MYFVNLTCQLSLPGMLRLSLSTQKAINSLKPDKNLTSDTVWVYKVVKSSCFCDSSLSQRLSSVLRLSHHILDSPLPPVILWSPCAWSECQSSRRLWRMWSELLPCFCLRIPGKPWGSCGTGDERDSSPTDCSWIFFGTGLISGLLASPRAGRTSVRGASADKACSSEGLKAATRFYLLRAACLAEREGTAEGQKHAGFIWYLHAWR